MWQMSGKSLYLSSLSANNGCREANHINSCVKLTAVRVREDLKSLACKSNANDGTSLKRKDISDQSGKPQILHYS